MYKTDLIILEDLRGLAQNKKNEEATAAADNTAQTRSTSSRPVRAGSQHFIAISKRTSKEAVLLYTVISVLTKQPETVPSEKIFPAFGGRGIVVLALSDFS